jgi:sugar phosphate isomerase/epimerase
MEFACHTWGFHDRPLVEALGTIARMGFRYVDLGTGPHLELNRIARDPRGIALEIRQELALFNLKLSDIYLMLPRISLADESNRARDIELFKRLLPFIVALETPGVTLSPGLVHPEDDTEALERTVAALREMVDAAEAATPVTRLQVSIEPHMDSMAQTPEQAKAILDRVEGLQITLDWAQFVYADVFHDRIVSLLPFTRHVQIRQAARAQLQTPFDRGRIDVTKVVNALQEAGYDDVVCVEYMQTKSERHGLIDVDAVKEAVQLRDALRDARDGQPVSD